MSDTTPNARKNLPQRSKTPLKAEQTSIKTRRLPQCTCDNITPSLTKTSVCRNVHNVDLSKLVRANSGEENEWRITGMNRSNSLDKPSGSNKKPSKKGRRFCSNISFNASPKLRQRASRCEVFLKPSDGRRIS